MGAFTVYRRARKNGSRPFYVQYTNPETGLQCNALSINKLFWLLGGSRNETVHRKAVAWEVAYKALQAGIVCSKKFETKAEAKIPFAEYGAKFWDFETSDYIKRRNKEKPNSITKGTADKEKKLFERFAIPLLPKGIKLSQVKGSDMERIRDSLFGLDVSNSTINKVPQALRSPLKEAYRLGYIGANIGEQIRNATPTPKETGILSSKDIWKKRGAGDTGTGASVIS